MERKGEIYCALKTNFPKKKKIDYYFYYNRKNDNTYPKLTKVI